MKQNKLKLSLIASSLLLGSVQINAQCTVPNPVTATPSVICAGATTSLNATSVGSSISWFTVPTGGVSTGTSASAANFAVSPVNTTTYYAEAFGVGSSTTVLTANYTGSVQSFTVPAGVTTLTVDARGAQGGLAGGLGARISGVFTVTPGDVMNIIVGQQGGSASNGIGGGGGGSFVWKVTGTVLYVAAGGGGGFSNNGGAPPGAGSSTTLTTNSTGGAGNGAGGINGNGGTGGVRIQVIGSGEGSGGAGCGWLSNGLAGTLSANNATGGFSPANGGAGGTGVNTPCSTTTVSGGFGGGGGAAGCSGASGGGGGFNGGGGGNGWNGGAWGSGGGGGSFNGGTSQSNTAGVQTGNGLVTITYVPGCTSAQRTPIVVTVNPNPTITVSSGSVCAGQSFTMVASGANTYTYSSGSAVVTPTANANYSVTGTSAAGCLSSNTAVSSVTVNASPAVAITGGTAAICAGQSVNLTANGANTYNWNTGATTSTIAPTPTANVTYTVVGTSSVTGCNGQAVQSVTVNALPTVTASSSTSGSICAGQSVSLTASGAATYSWNTGATTAVIAVSPSVTTTYTVNGVAVNGCANVSTVTQNVNSCVGIQTTNSKQLAINVYPNPSNGNFTVELANGLAKVINVTDITGRVILTTTSSLDAVNVNISTLSNGIYYIKVASDNKAEVIKVVKQ